MATPPPRPPVSPVPEEPEAEGIAAAHLSDDALNAVLDGEAGTDEAAHARACPRCSARLERLRRVALAVAGPVAPVSAERRRAAVARAMAVGLTGAGEDEGEGAGQDDRGGEGDDGKGTTGTPVAPGAHPAMVTVLADRPRRQQGRWNRGAAWGAAAAGVVALALTVPLLDQLTGLSDGQDSATSSAQESADAGTASGAPGDVDIGGGGIDGGDLGNLDRAGFAALVERFDRDLDPSASGELAPRPFDQSAEAGRAQPGGQSSPALGDTEGAPPPSEPGALVERCERAVRERDPDHGALLYVAQARFEGVGAVILGFDSPVPPGGGGSPVGRGAQIIVVASGDCRELASASP